MLLLKWRNSVLEITEHKLPREESVQSQNSEKCAKLIDLTPPPEHSLPRVSAGSKITRLWPFVTRNFLVRRTNKSMQNLFPREWTLWFLRNTENKKKMSINSGFCFTKKLLLHSFSAPGKKTLIIFWLFMLSRRTSEIVLKVTLVKLLVFPDQSWLLVLTWILLCEFARSEHNTVWVSSLFLKRNISYCDTSSSSLMSVLSRLTAFADNCGVQWQWSQFLWKIFIKTGRGHLCTVK